MKPSSKTAWDFSDPLLRQYQFVSRHTTFVVVNEEFIHLPLSLLSAALALGL